MNKIRTLKLSLLLIHYKLFVERHPLKFIMYIKQKYASPVTCQFKGKENTENAFKSMKARCVI